MHRVEEISLLRDQVEAVEADRDRWRRYAGMLRDRLAAAQDAVRKWHHHAYCRDYYNGRVGEELRDLAGERDALKRQLAECQVDLERARTACRETNEARENLLAGNRELRQQLAEAKAELRRWRGCPSCLEDHPENTICPPYETRVTGQAWRQRQTRQWEEVARIAEDLARRNADRAEKAERDADMWHQSYQQDAELRSIDRRRAEKAERERDEANELRTQEAHMLAKAIIRVERADAEAALLREALETIAASTAGDDEPGDRSPRRAGWECVQRARAALASDAGEKAAAVLALAPLIDQLLSSPSDGTPEMDAKSAELAERWHAAVAAMEADRG